jgi:murein DD-endopeptidase MepM/ murein hydrolase activator NlpD
MQKLIIHLPKYRLTVNYKLSKRRRSSLDEPIIPTIKTLNLKYRVGGITRKFFRHVFEHRKIKTILGSNIALMLIATSFIPSNAIGSINPPTNEVLIVNEAEAPISTKVAIQLPVEVKRVTQGYGFFHPGIDLDGTTGDPIKPMKNGKVIKIDHSRFAYGNSIIVDHGNNLTSLYAHLSKIYVKEGQEVTTDTVLGEMGSTGRSTGDHLHLEVRDHGIPINPLSVLPK